jgi:alanyl-tRNA synthetase
MPTERLYYDDSYLRRFDARVTGRAEWNGRPAVALDRSAFYPEGGGQPGDRGTLGGVQVLDTQARDGEVWQLLERPLDADEVAGEIDWPRRFDHMQQHHGQHLLSAAFVQACSMATLSFHLGAASSTIDLDAAALSAEQAAAAEELANSVVWEDRPVLARFVSDAELAALPLRKAPSVSGPLRVVSVPNFDHSACGGTHPRSTGGVGLIALQGWSRQKAGVRVEFVCGQRALLDHRRLNAITARLAAGLSVAADQLEATVERLRASEAAARRNMESAQAALLDYEALNLLAGAVRAGDALVVRTIFAQRDAGELRYLAQRIAARAGGVALLGLRGPKAQLVFARAEGLALDAGALLRAALPFIGGRGGGQAALAQGGGPDAAGLERALDAAFALIAHRRGAEPALS